MTVKHDATRAAVLGALKDLIDSEYQDTRGDVLEGLLTVREDIGVKSINVELPDGTNVATATLTEPSSSITVTDRNAFVKWVQANTPEQVPEPVDPKQRVTDAIAAAHHEIHQIYNDNEGEGPGPAEIDQITAGHVLAALGINPEPEAPKVNPSYEKELLDSLILGPDGLALEPETGEIVHGVTATAAGRPTQFSMRFTKHGRDEVARAWRAGDLKELDGVFSPTEIEVGDAA